MILVDTSVWIAHFQKGVPKLAGLLENAAVLTHPLVIGEIACGQLRNRKEILDYLRALPSVKPATEEEVHHLLEAQKLWGRGIGWIDLHLLASSLITPCYLWTLDRRLTAAAELAATSQQAV
jgi:predicted nucleic acid-binding protein